jgi:hypothetical protein
MRDTTALFEWDLARNNGRSMTSESSGFVGMMEWDLESLYDLLLATQTLSPILRGATVR